MKHDGSDDPKTANSGTETEQSRALPALDFSTFLLSLASSAMVNLGQVPAPGSETAERNLPAAKQIIDIISMLADKTRGNLDDSEDKLTKSLLYDLRIQYVDAQKDAAKP